MTTTSVVLLDDDDDDDDEGDDARAEDFVFIAVGMSVRAGATEVVVTAIGFGS